MEIERKEAGEYFFPFSELVNGDYFTFHHDHLKENVTIFLKTGSHSYRDESIDQEYKILHELIHKTKVALVPLEYYF